MNGRSKLLALVSTRRKLGSRLNELEKSALVDARACSFGERASDVPARIRIRHWTATGAFWGGAWGLLGGPTLFYSATGTGLEADVKQALASLITGAAGTLIGAACAGICAMLTRRRQSSVDARQFTPGGLRLVNVSEARAYGLYHDQRPMLAVPEEPEQ